MMGREDQSDGGGAVMHGDERNDDDLALCGDHIRSHQLYPQLVSACMENSCEGLTDSIGQEREERTMCPALEHGCTANREDQPHQKVDVNAFVNDALDSVQANTESQRQANQHLQDARSVLLGNLVLPLKTRMDSATRLRIVQAADGTEIVGCESGPEMRQRFQEAVSTIRKARSKKRRTQ
jgi:hypothetical protein